MLLDSHAWMELFRGTLKGERVKQIINQQTCYSSAISIAEVSDCFNREGRGDFPHLLIMESNSTILPVENQLLEKAGAIKSEKRKKIKDFGLIDAIILATAKQYGLAVVTGDPHFAGENTLSI